MGKIYILLQYSCLVFDNIYIYMIKEESLALLEVVVSVIVRNKTLYEYVSLSQ